MKGYEMESKVTPRYDSIQCVIPVVLQDDFLIECKLMGVDAGKTLYFSTKPLDEFLRIIYDSWDEYAPKILKLLLSFRTKHKIKIEIRTDSKLIELEGLSVDEALKLISAAQSIEVKHLPSLEKASDS
jgi:hypothetical protein